MDFLSGSSAGVLGANSSGCSEFADATAGKPPPFHLPKLSRLLWPSVTLPKPVHWNCFLSSHCIPLPWTAFLKLCLVLWFGLVLIYQWYKEHPRDIYVLCTAETDTYKAPCPERLCPMWRDRHAGEWKDCKERKKVRGSSMQWRWTWGCMTDTGCIQEKHGKSCKRSFEIRPRTQKESHFCVTVACLVRPVVTIATRVHSWVRSKMTFLFSGLHSTSLYYEH